MHPRHSPEIPIHRRYLTAPLLRRESIGAIYHVLTFEAPEPVVAEPGQFAMLRGADWGITPLLPRPMSLLDGGATPAVLVKVVGDATRRLAVSSPGERFTLLAPLGSTWRPPVPGARPLLVAGGVGVAPLLFLARTLAAQGLHPVALYGGRTGRDLPLHDDLGEVADVHLATEDGTIGHRGRVTDLLPRFLQRGVCVYTCGPERMMAKVADQCAEAKIRCDVSLETPMACGYGVCLGCARRAPGGGYIYACVEGPCLDSQRIDWSAAVTGGGDP